jgi:hypothetical protein
MYGEHYGRGHRWCETCSHGVRSGYGGCSRCGTAFGELALMDDMLMGGMAPGGISFDPMDGQFAVDIPGTDLAVEPGTGQVDLDVDGFDIPL